MVYFKKERRRSLYQESAFFTTWCFKLKKIRFSGKDSKGCTANSWRKASRM